MRSSSQYSFARVPSVEIPRSSFNRSFTYKSAFNEGVLIPFYVDEALPGDSFNFRMTAFSRLATPVVPFMDNLYMDFQFFAVPIRLVWDHFTRMMGEQPNPGDSTDFLVPQIVVDSEADVPAVGSIHDYMGIPPGVVPASQKKYSWSSLWCRAYNLIWNEWFRDENLQNSVTVKKDDLDEAPGDYHLLPRGKRHDYYSSCLPWPEKGPGVELPLGDMAPVFGSGEPIGLYPTSSSDPFADSVNLRAKTSGDLTTGSSYSAAKLMSFFPDRAHINEEDTSLFADLSLATGATINTLRQAFQLQRLLERDARGGTRYTELIRSHFGVVSPDARLQRPEYLGGGTIPIQIHSVAQTSSTDSVTPQGNLAAYGVAAKSGIGFSKSFTEHTLLIGLVSVRADLTYQQGIPRMFSRRSRWDFYWPALSHLGEQAVLNKEIFLGSDSDDKNDEVFGYQERWAEYRYGINKITGKLRSGVSGSLDVWHLAQHFASLPALNSDFIEEHPPIDRVVAVQDEPHFIFDSLVNLSCVRPMPMYSVPGLMDHF